MSDMIISAEKRGFFSLFSNMFFDPFSTYAYIRDHVSRAWLLWGFLALLITAVPTIIGGIAQSENIAQMMEESRANVVTEDGTPPPMPSWTGPSIIAFSAISILIFTLISWFLWSGLLFLFSSMFGGNITFGKVFQMAVWAHLPFSIQAIFTAIYLGLTKKLEMPSLSLASLLQSPMGNTESITPPTTADLALYNVAQRIEFFSIWHLLLLIIGLVVVTRLPKGKSAAIVIGLWVVSIFIGAGFTSVLSGIGASFGG